MDNNYFYVDGSSLIAQVKRIWSKHKKFNNRKLILQNFVSHFVSGRLAPYTNRRYKRFVFYFPSGGDEQNKYIIFPDRKVASGNEDDVSILMCGRKVKKLKGYDVLEAYVDKKHPNLKDVIRRAEKGIDTQICCDAMQLAATGRLDRLFLCTNDSDFLPLIKVLKTMGTNVNIFHLSTDTKLEESLAVERDAYHVVDTTSLESLFEPLTE